ncbi:MAG: transpeptidase family protein [Spirochaetaceae bacterium]|nr:transpeptidase family protein [Spirochaetaceae bacterium]
MVDRPATFRMRILIAISLTAALFIVIRFAFIMLSPNRTDSAPVHAPAKAERGSIVDREGRLIALQTRLWSVTAWKPEIVDPLITGSLLGPVLDMDPNTISRMLSGGNSSRFLFIQRQVTPTQSDAVRKLIEEGRLPGIGLQEELGRHYPMKELAAPLIGHVGTDNIGLDGIEYAFNRVLAPGSMTSDTDRLYGHTVYLTLDMNAQYLVERIAGEAWDEHHPDSMMILVMNAKTAEILSWVSLPSYDPNTFSESTWNERINRPLAVAFEPGSVFKVFTWSTFLDMGGVRIDDTFDTRGGYKPELFVRYDIPSISDLANYGILDVPGALIHSSNVAVAMASESISSTDFYKSLKNFGFGSPTGLPLSGESHGLLNPVSGWSARSKPTIAIGQEVGVSAIQIVSAATTLANGGVLLQPRIVEKVIAADGSVIKEYPRTPVREVISPKTARTVLELMEQTVASPSGTSHRAAVPGLRISAKSGTAQITDPETGRYSSDRFLSSVLALFPTDDPEIIVYVVIENPRGASIYGAQTAAPMVRDIAEILAPIYGIPLAGNTVMEHSGRVKIDNPEPMPLGEELHDLTGYSKRMLLPYLEREDITWTINGNGWVVFQFPPPGTPIESGMSIFLELK